MEESGVKATQPGNCCIVAAKTPAFTVHGQHCTVSDMEEVNYGKNLSGRNVTII